MVYPQTIVICVVICKQFVLYLFIIIKNDTRNMAEDKSYEFWCRKTALWLMWCWSSQ